MAGYSGTPLAKKLGIKAGMSLVILGADEFDIPELPEDVTVHRSLKDADVFVIFATEANEAVADYRATMPHLPADGAVWMAWPKRASGLQTNITEDTLRDLFLPTGLVDNKVCAIDETWSGLRFVVRKENRPGWNKTGE